MMDLSHRVKIFVYSFRDGTPRYLLLKHPPFHEGFWGPVCGPIKPWENPERAVLRQVKEETGILVPRNLLDLKTPDRFQMGEFELVEWNYGYQVSGDSLPAIQPAPEIEDFRWDSFDNAYQCMELEENRKAMVRLHMLLAG